MPRTEDGLQVIVRAALEGLEVAVLEMGDDISDTLKNALSDAATHGGMLLEGILEKRINKFELKAALNELKETIEGIIAGQVFDKQREVLELFTHTVVKYLPQLLALI